MSDSPSDGSSRESPYYLQVRGECDGCDELELLAVTESGRYCSQCIPDEDLAILLHDLYRAE